MKTINAVLSVIMVNAFLACAQDTVSTDTVVHVNSEKFRELIAKGEGMLIDLRTPDELKRGYIKGAVNLDYLSAEKDFEKEIEKLDKSKTYYVYCESGGRSADAADLMKKHGFKKVYNLEKGFFNWKKKGFEYSTP